MEMCSSQQQKRDVIAMGSLFSAFVTLSSGVLFRLVAKLLNVPAHCSLLLDCGGSIFRYPIHENTLHNMIYRQLQADQNKIDGREELGECIGSITQA